MDNTFNKISKINNLMSEFINLELQKIGYKDLVSSHGTILRVLFDKEAVTMCNIAKAINKKPQTVTTLIEKLSNKGLVVIEKNENDKRQTIVKLTEEGQKLKVDVLRISNDLYETQYKNINTEDLQTFKKVLNAIENNFLK